MTFCLLKICEFLSERASWRARHLRATSAVCLGDAGGWMLTAGGQRRGGRWGVPLLPAGTLGPAAATSACSQRGRAPPGSAFCLRCTYWATHRLQSITSWDAITKIWHCILSMALQVLCRVPVSDMHVVYKWEFNIKMEMKIFLYLSWANTNTKKTNPLPSPTNFWNHTCLAYLWVSSYISSPSKVSKKGHLNVHGHSE